jgi:hypothetical protein
MFLIRYLEPANFFALGGLTFLSLGNLIIYIYIILTTTENWTLIKLK